MHTTACENAEFHLHPQLKPAARADASDEAIRGWLHEVMRITGLKPTPLAKGAGLAPSTLLRALDPALGGSLERRSIDKIVHKYGVAPPALYADGAATRPAGLAEPELVRYETPGNDHDLPLAATEGEWTIRTRALELVGYLPGDRVRADSAQQPRARDVVVAQVIDQMRGTAETVLRVYDPPYLMTETADPACRRKPLLVDGDSVAIWGVVMRSVRTRDV